MAPALVAEALDHVPVESDPSNGDDGEDRDSGPPQRAPRQCPRRLHRPILPPPLLAREKGKR
jgi:hypothetical protein